MQEPKKKFEICGEKLEIKQKLIFMEKETEKFHITLEILYF